MTNGYQIQGLGAPQQRFYYAGAGQPAGRRALTHSNLAHAPGLGNNGQNGVTTLLLIGALLYAFGAFGGGALMGRR